MVNQILSDIINIIVVKCLVACSFPTYFLTSHIYFLFLLRFCYYNPDEYVARPFPCLWKCGVVHPAGLDPLSGEMKHLQGLSWSLEKLVKMKQGISLFHLECGMSCVSIQSGTGIVYCDV